jgi:hypothetical protein
MHEWLIYFSSGWVSSHVIIIYKVTLRISDNFQLFHWCTLHVSISIFPLSNVMLEEKVFFPLWVCVGVCCWNNIWLNDTFFAYFTQRKMWKKDIYSRASKLGLVHFRRKLISPKKIFLFFFADIYIILRWKRTRKFFRRKQTRKFSSTKKNTKIFFGENGIHRKLFDFSAFMKCFSVVHLRTRIKMSKSDGCRM